MKFHWLAICYKGTLYQQVREYAPFLVTCIAVISLLMTRSITFYHLFFLTLVLACFGACAPAFAQQDNKQVIRLKTGTISTNANAGRWIDSMNMLPPAKDPQLVLVHFTQLPTPEQCAVLQAAGITLLDYIPDNTYAAFVKMPLNADVISSLPIHSIIDHRPEWKADSYVWKKAANERGAIEVLVSVYPGTDAGMVKQFVTQLGGRINAGPLEKYGSYKVIIPAGSLRAVAAWYRVRYISPVTAIVPLDLQSMPPVKGNIASGPIAYGGYGLEGDSVCVGVGDESSGIYHADIKDRIINFNPAPPAHHGEFVNGIVGGAANIDPLAISITPHVLMVDHLFDLILPATGAMLHDHNMTITNNSYEVIAGDCAYAGTYDGYARLLDTLAIQYPQVQHVFASGNDGGSFCSPFLSGFATVGGGYQPAKNNIVVGSITDYLVESPDESRGPVKDGRLKPDIVAIGLGAYSDIDVDQYEWSAGTSMASPQVASGLAALTQRYKQLNAGVQPRADLLKTILLNGAMDLGNPGPDFSYGFGVMDLYRSLQIMDNRRYVSGTMSNAGTETFNITVPANTGQLKVMLYWNDVPASLLSAKQLVNDLDLSVSDPLGAQHLPLVPDAAPANVNNNATEQPDHLNNVEQVTITNPSAGTYAVNVNGFSVPQGPQRFVVAYDFVPRDVHLTFPHGGEQLSNVDSIRIFWNAVSDSNTFTVEFSSNNGSTWNTIANNVPADIRHCDFLPSGYNSGNCLVRVLRNNTSEADISGRFSISTQPVVILDTAQCPGYVNIHWSAVPGVTAYLLLKKSGYYMQAVDSVSDTAYSFGNMPLDATSYVAVQPVINGMHGYRSVAVSTVANTGNCTKPVSTGDLMIDSILSPVSGRMYTSTRLNGAVLQVRLRDMYRFACTNYSLSYRINSGTWNVATSLPTIPANGTAVVTIPGLDLSDTGVYNIAIAIQNLNFSDPQPGNDTVSFTVQNLPNDTMDLTTPFFDGFEAMPIFAVQHDSLGVSPNSHWDYFNTNDSGRLRSFVDDDVTITGSRSVSLDEDRAVSNGSNNAFVGTFDLAGYDTATAEIRIDFDYILHGTPKTAAGNLVAARGDDTAAWSPFFTYDFNTYPGTVNHVQSLSLTDVIRFSKHDFSTSTQVSFGQNDTSLIAAANYGNGLTLDNFRMYTVANDAMLVGVVAPVPVGCGLPASVPLTVRVHNGVNYTLHNVQLYYSMDSGIVFSGTLDSIRAKDTVTYAFAQQLNVAPGSVHNLNIWLHEAGDTYAANDSILNYKFRNSPIISTFPYLENFEAGNGGYFTDGINNSWQYGTPASAAIHKAASGTKAWKTNLTGKYNNLEHSYLYSPCFDISQLMHPMLSVSIALDIENCGSTLCDAGYVEYSFDGETWSKLGNDGQGTNWYDSTFNIWNTEGFTRWHVASIPLPQPPVGASLHFRFVLNSDPGATFEGIAVDDIHIYDLVYPILPAAGITAVTQNLNNNVWTDIVRSGQVLSSIQPGSQAINNTTVTLYNHDTLANADATQYTFPRSYTIQAVQSPADSVLLRLYLLDSDVVNVLNNFSCPSCAPVTDAYSLGITQYDDHNNAALENGSLADDTGGVFTYYPHNVVKWVPYDKGYYAELTTKPFSEFWFNNGGPTGTFAVNSAYLNFLAFRSGPKVTTYWYSLIDTSVTAYLLQRSSDSINFTTVVDTAATHTNPGEYTYTDAVNLTSSAIWYYRLQWTMSDGNTYYSPIRKVNYSDTANGLVTLSARSVGDHKAQVSWLSYIDGMVDHYVLDRAVENNSYTNIANTPALRHYGQQYNVIDAPPIAIPSLTPVHYRLTAILDDSSRIVLPVCTIAWDNGNSIVNVYPNPTYDGSISIVWHAEAGTVMQVHITDALGREKFETTATSVQWNNITTIQTFNHAKGVYFVRFDIGGERYTAKVVYE